MRCSRQIPDALRRTDAAARLRDTRPGRPVKPCMSKDQQACQSLVDCYGARESLLNFKLQHHNIAALHKVRFPSTYDHFKLSLRCEVAQSRRYRLMRL